MTEGNVAELPASTREKLKKLKKDPTFARFVRVTPSSGAWALRICVWIGGALAVALVLFLLAASASSHAVESEKRLRVPIFTWVGFAIAFGTAISNGFRLLRFVRTRQTAHAAVILQTYRSEGVVGGAFERLRRGDFSTPSKWRVVAALEGRGRADLETSKAVWDRLTEDHGGIAHVRADVLVDFHDLDVR